MRQVYCHMLKQQGLLTVFVRCVTHTKIEEVGAANFFGITRDNEFVTPNSPSFYPALPDNPNDCSKDLRYGG